MDITKNQASKSIRRKEIASKIADLFGRNCNHVDRFGNLKKWQKFCVSVNFIENDHILRN